MGKKVRVWICWRFHWLTVGTDKWGPPSFTIWPTATLFLIKCSILKGHVSTCLDPSKLDQDGEPHIETSPLPGRGLLPPQSGKGPCLTTGQKPASLAPASHAPTPLLAALGGTYFHAPAQRGVLGVHSTILTSLCTATDCLNYPQLQCGNQSGVKSSGAIFKAHPIWGQGPSPASAPTHTCMRTVPGAPQGEGIMHWPKMPFLSSWPLNSIYHCREEHFRAPLLLPGRGNQTPQN